jgi:ADP-heptose:LPS heptosyltransferase
LAGSSVHKFYPYQDAVIARILLERPDCRIFLVGDAACKILEVGWEKEDRVVCLSGEINIRQTLTLAKICDAVVGPETGVLNAVAFDSNRKVCLLSHSSHENLTKHWVNAAAIEPLCPCYPCHRLHYTWDHCSMNETTSSSECQSSIDPARVTAAILETAA